MADKKMTGAEMVEAGKVFRIALAQLYKGSQGILASDAKEELKKEGQDDFKMPLTASDERGRRQQEKLLKGVDKAIEFAQSIADAETAAAAVAPKVVKAVKAQPVA